MDTAHRKIELQHPDDFAYLVENVRQAAAARVGEAFPPVLVDGAATATSRSKKKRSTAAAPVTTNDGDDLHARVESLVNEYIFRTFSLAAPNLTINGLPVDPAPFWEDEHGKGSKSKKKTKAEDIAVFAPFDARKRQRVEDLTREEEDLLRDIAALKRKVPAAALRAHARWLDGAMSADVATAAAVASQVESGAEAKLETVAEDKKTTSPESAASFSSAVARLDRLKQAMPATVARMERARVAGTYAMAET